MNLQSIRDLVSDVNTYDENNWEETTRDERYWMQEARTLALEILKFYT